MMISKVTVITAGRPPARGLIVRPAVIHLSSFQQPPTVTVQSRRFSRNHAPSPFSWKSRFASKSKFTTDDLSRHLSTVASGGKGNNYHKKKELNDGKNQAMPKKNKSVKDRHVMYSSTLQNNKETTDTDTAVVEPAKKKRPPLPWILDMGVPSLVPEWKKMFQNPTTVLSDVSAGVTVGCVAVPLSLAIAVASGVPPQVGLVTAAVSGVAGGLLGGTTLAITGPAAAISLLVVSAVQTHGLEALPVITLAVGGLQVASGVTRLGVAAKLVPISVIAGFTTGVGTMILSGQLPKALGVAAPAGMNPIEVLGFLAEHVSLINPASAALAFGTSAAMWGLPKIHAKMPAALLAVGGATAATHGMGLDVQLIGSLPSGLDAFQFGIPMMDMPPVESMPSLAATIFLIYAMTSAESLLSCAALEKMKKTSYKHHPDQELIGQGLANVGAGMFMGMPVTSVIARSGLNVRLNAETRLPALVQAGFVFSSVVFFSDSISNIPMPALSGMLITTGLSMLNPTEFQHCYAVQKLDTIPFITTIGGMVAFGLAEGIGIGCASAVALQYATATSVGASPGSGSSMIKLQVVAPTTTVPIWTLKGPINFMSMFEIDNMMQDLKESSSASSGGAAAATQPIVVDVGSVTNLEFTGVEELVNRLLEQGHTRNVPVHLINVSDTMDQALDQCDVKREIIRFPAAAAASTSI